MAKGYSYVIWTFTAHTDRCWLYILFSSRSAPMIWSSSELVRVRDTQSKYGWWPYWLEKENRTQIFAKLSKMIVLKRIRYWFCTYHTITTHVLLVSLSLGIRWLARRAAQVGNQFPSIIYTNITFFRFKLFSFYFCPISFRSLVQPFANPSVQLSTTAATNGSLDN